MKIDTKAVLAAAGRARDSREKWRTIDELADAFPKATKNQLLDAIQRDQDAGLLDGMNPRWAWPTKAGNEWRELPA